MSASDTFRNHVAFIWSVADLLRGDYQQSEYVPRLKGVKLHGLREPYVSQTEDAHEVGA